MAKIVGFIPSRLNSERVPQKNIRKLGGIPLVNYTVRSLDKVPEIDEVVIYASEPSICTYIEQGLRYRFVARPVFLDTQTARIQDIIEQFLKETDADIVVLLQANTLRFIAAYHLPSDQLPIQSIYSFKMSASIARVLLFLHKETVLSQDLLQGVRFKTYRIWKRMRDSGFAEGVSEKMVRTALARLADVGLLSFTQQGKVKSYTKGILLKDISQMEVFKIILERLILFDQIVKSSDRVKTLSRLSQESPIFKNVDLLTQMDKEMIKAHFMNVLASFQQVPLNTATTFRLFSVSA